MHSLSSSGKSLADIQTAWHNYYQQLPDDQKHQVWQEFYSNYNRTTVTKPPAENQQQAHSAPTPSARKEHRPKRTRNNPRSVDEIQRHLRSTIRGRADQKKQHHASSIKFGLVAGVLSMVIVLFGFFNERFIAPFITPSRTLSSTPLIIDENGAVGPEPKLVIPKINVDVPVVYDEESIAEDDVQNALEDGVLHYATTPDPGEFGNSVVFGHSSNNILNRGDYKFAFVLLNKMDIGDTFFVHKEGTRYTYRVFEKKIVAPEEVSVLGDAGKTASMTLITCDPPGTAINRLVVIGEQITPSADSNVASSATPLETEPDILPSNAPSLWDRMTSWLSS